MNSSHQKLHFNRKKTGMQGSMWRVTKEDLLKNVWMTKAIQTVSYGQNYCPEKCVCRGLLFSFIFSWESSKL